MNSSLALRRARLRSPSSQGFGSSSRTPSSESRSGGTCSGHPEISSRARTNHQTSELRRKEVTAMALKTLFKQPTLTSLAKTCG